MNSKEVLSEFMIAFSKNLTELRENKYKHAADMSKVSSFDPSNYNKYEQGEGNPTIETILKLASALNIPPKELFNFDFDFEKFKIEE